MTTKITIEDDDANRQLILTLKQDGEEDQIKTVSKRTMSSLVMIESINRVLFEPDKTESGGVLS